MKNILKIILFILFLTSEAFAGNGSAYSSLKVASVDLTAQTAAIAATTVYAVPIDQQGFYRVCYVASVTTAGSVSSTLGGATGFQLKYTDNDDSVVKTTNFTTIVVSAQNTTATNISECLSAWAKVSTNLQYIFGYTSAGTAMAYNLHITVEYLGG